jgi:transcriptional accessory protein Tex/SPT6
LALTYGAWQEKEKRMMSDQESAKTAETTEVESALSSQPSPSEPAADLEAAEAAVEESVQDSDEPAAVSTETAIDEASVETVESATGPAEKAAPAPMSIDSLRVGQRLTGKVKNITKFGAFVDVGIPQDGLVHISKLAKWKVDKVTDVVSQGQEVEVWVKKVDKKRGRLSLTMIKPISFRLKDIKEGAELEGVVTRLEPYGAFVDIGSEREGLVHISQISHDYIKHPEEVLAVDDKVTVKVLKVDRKKRQVDLSIKALLSPPQKEEKVEKKVEEVQETEEEVAEESSLTAMAIAYTALQDKQQSTKETKKSAVKDKRQQSDEMDAIITRTLAGRE